MATSEAPFDPVTTAILTAPLRLSQPRWTSDDVAASLGTSQSAVARTWRRVYAGQAPAGLPSQVRLIGVDIREGRCVLVVRAWRTATASPAPQLPGVMRSPRRIPLQTLLAAVLAQSADQGTAAAPPATLTQASGGADMEAIGSGPRPNWLPAGTSYTHVAEPQWQALLGWLIAAAAPTDAGSLRNLHQELIVWAGDPTLPFTWVAEPARARPRPAEPTRPSRPRSTQQVVADQVFEAIVGMVWDGVLTAGDRITESSLARQLHTTRNQTRDALRALASAGLVDHHPVRGVLVPAPSRRDVMDIYAARRALGTDIIRRAIENPSLNIAALEQALDAVLTSAQTGNSYETGNADLAFQDAIAEHAGMRNIPQMFQVLAKQLRLYIAVMGLRYFYAIDDMVRDDSEILHHIKARDTDAAIKAWHRKVADAVTYMTGQVGRYK